VSGAGDMETAPLYLTVSLRTLTVRLVVTPTEMGCSQRFLYVFTHTLLLGFLVRNSISDGWKKSQLSWVNPGIQGEIPSD
jgi:hypothetical protein